MKTCRLLSKIGLIGLSTALPACVDVPNDADLESPAEDVGEDAAPITVDTDATYTIVSVKSDKCVEIAGGSSSNGAAVQIAPCDAGKEQQFRIEDMGGGYYRVKNVNSNLCLDVPAKSMVAGTALIQYNCSLGTNQQWSLQDIGENGTKLTARHSGQGMATQGTANGSKVIQNTSNNSADQQFWLKPLRQMEDLDRGVVAVKVNGGVYVGWRLLGTEPASVSFNVYRGATKVNASPITGSTNLLDPNGVAGSTYTVRAVIGGVEQAASKITGVWLQNYLTIPIQTPAGYTPGDASVGDLDGDGQYEIILKQENTPKDNSQSGFTGQTLLQAYKLDGTLLWTIDLGKNIREGAHYTQFMVYDLDGDGRAEVACKTADGTKDGKGKVIGNANADHRNAGGYILSGPEYLTVFDGLTGGALATVNYNPPRGTVSSWGDNYGNRVDRFLAGIAYLDGRRPSLVMARGYYTRAVIAAWNFRDGQLTPVWTFDTNDGYPGYMGQGNHSLSIADVDKDGRDEIIYGAAAINDDGTGLYSTGLGHGDALHVSDMDPSRPGLEVFQPHEVPSQTAGLEYRDAATGALLFGVPSTGDVGRGIAMDMDPNFPGFEAWGNGPGVAGIYNLKTGQQVAPQPSLAANFGVFWDQDTMREHLDGTKVDKWRFDLSPKQFWRILSAHNFGAASNNGTKANPALSADLLGDWREEIVYRKSDNTALLLFTTTSVTSHRIHTLVHDSQYRVAVAFQNVGYNQPPHTSFFMGADMATPAQPSIYVK